MAIIDTLFMTKTAENHTLWGRTYLYSPYKGVPPRGFSGSPGPYLKVSRKEFFLQLERLTRHCGGLKSILLQEASSGEQFLQLRVIRRQMT